MKQETLSEALLRKFLLGKVDEEERERIESMFLVDPGAKQKIFAAEQDLIEDYLENSLTPAESEIFLSVYAQTAEQRQSLRITQSIKVLAGAEVVSSRTVSARTEGWTRFRERLWLRPPLYVPIAVAVAIAIVTTVIWLNSRTREQRLAVEQQLAQLNTPSSVPSQMVSLDLSPVSMRGADRQIEFKRNAAVQVVELRLPSFQTKHFSLYEAEVRRLDDDDAFTIRNLQPESDGRYATRIRLPVNILRPGQYEVRLTGMPKNGVTEEYQFTVAD